MTTQTIRCANCAGAVTFPPGHNLTTCAYCGFQVQLAGGAPPLAAPQPAGPALATSIGVRVSPSLTIPLLTAGTGVPAQHNETLSTQRDDQESITIDLVNGANDLVKIVFAINARQPRGTVKVQLLVKVDEHGSATVFVTEQGTTNTTRRDGLRVEIG